MIALPFHKERFVLTLAAYLDDSGKAGDAPVVLVAGLLTEDSSWIKFDGVWQAFLDDFELRKFHACEFWARRSRPYVGWSNEKHALAVERISDILRHLPVFGLGTAVEVSVFNEWRDSLNFYTDPDPYYFCLDRCLRQLIRGIRKNGVDDGIAIYIDQDKQKEQLGQKLAEWHEGLLRKRGSGHLDENRVISTHYVPSFRYKPLQAADIFAHSSFQQFRDYIECNTWNDPPFLSALKRGNKAIGVQNFHNIEQFEIEAKNFS